MNEEILRQEFLNFLANQKNYPSESLILEYPISIGKRQARADLILLDTKNKTFIGLIEFKGQITEQNKRTSIDQVNSYKSLLGNKTISTYLAGYQDQMLTVYILTQKNEWQKIELKDFPNYNSLVAGEIAKEKSISESEKKKLIDWFRIICYFFGGSSIVLFILIKFIKLFTLDSTDLLLLGGGIALFIIPSAVKLKLFGVEFERKEKDK